MARMKGMTLKMGTRGSPLALAQSGQLARRLEALTPGLKVETVVIKTSGDAFSLARPNEPYAPEGGAKGLFVKEIEDALLAGTIDFAVHSGKDLPAELADGCVIAAYPAREEARDAFVGKGGGRLADLKPGARVATSSLRRQLQLKAARPDLVFVAMRGNVDTRLRKMEEGSCDGLLLAEAGLRRLGRSDVKREVLSADLIVPAPVQGALAVETRTAPCAALDILAAIDDPDTRLCAEFEREVLIAVAGGCSTPLGVHASPDETVHAYFADADGSRAKRIRRKCRLDAEHARTLAAELRGA